jgi:hypothetical protein
MLKKIPGRVSCHGEIGYGSTAWYTLNGSFGVTAMHFISLHRQELVLNDVRLRLGELNGALFVAQQLI